MANGGTHNNILQLHKRAWRTHNGDRRLIRAALQQLPSEDVGGLLVVLHMTVSSTPLQSHSNLIAVLEGFRKAYPKLRVLPRLLKCIHANLCL